MRVKKSSNGWANLMVRATELSIPANRKTLRLVSLFVIHVKAQSKWKESQKLLKTRRLKSHNWWLEFISFSFLQFWSVGSLWFTLLGWGRSYLQTCYFLSMKFCHYRERAWDLYAYCHHSWDIYVVENIVWIPLGYGGFKTWWLRLYS